MIGVGAMLGTQAGTQISSRVRGSVIVRAFTIPLPFADLRLIAQALLGR